MKKFIQLAVILLAFVPSICKAQTEKNAWPAMTEFHTLMSASFHPVEQGNFEPLKANAEKLFTASRAWQKTAIPEESFKPKETKEALKKLVLDCNAVNKAVIAKKSNEELRALITKAHDSYHVIAGACRQEQND